MTTDTELRDFAWQRMPVDTSNINPWPRMDPQWTEFKRLTWKAGVVHAETGLNVEVRASIAGGFDAAVGQTLIEGQTFRHLWKALSGVAIGVREAKRFEGVA
jgi:hypothetical protein